MGIDKNRDLKTIILVYIYVYTLKKQQNPSMVMQDVNLGLLTHAMVFALSFGS